MTPDQMRQMAREIREAAEARARQLEAAADVIERAHSMALPSDESYATIATMATPNASDIVPRHRGAPLESEGPIATAARRLGVPAAEIARRLKVHPGTARNWDRRGKIPDLATREKLAEIIQTAKATKRPRQ
jgi:DNA-binding transcriptional regulator YiaG